MMEIKQSTATLALVFYMVDDADGITPKTGLSPTVTLSKNGGAFASPAGAVSEISGGFYKVAPNSTDSNTLGMLALKATASGAVPVAMAYLVVANIASDTISEIISLDGVVDSGFAGLATDIGNSELAVIGAIGGEVRTELATELGRIDAAVSTRNATAPDNAGIAAIKAKTDNLPSDPADQSLIISATDAVMARLGAPAGASIAADIAAIDGGGGGGATVEEIVDGVLDELLAGHAVAGSVGAALSAASASGDPWATVLPGSYDPGTAGAGIGRLNAVPGTGPVIVVPGPPDDGDSCLVYAFTESIIGVVREGIALTFKLATTPAAGERILEKAAVTVETDETGYAQIILRAGVKYSVKSGELGLNKTFTPAAGTFDLKEVIG